VFLFVISGSAYCSSECCFLPSHSLARSFPNKRRGPSVGSQRLSLRIARAFKGSPGSRSVRVCHQHDFFLELNFLKRSELHFSSCNLDQVGPRLRARKATLRFEEKLRAAKRGTPLQLKDSFAVLINLILPHVQGDF